MTLSAPATSAFAMSPELRMPQSARRVDGCSTRGRALRRWASHQRSMAARTLSTAVSCGAPQTVKTRVVHTALSPTPAYTAWAPASSITAFMLALMVGNSSVRSPTSHVPSETPLREYTEDRRGHDQRVVEHQPVLHKLDTHDETRSSRIALTDSCESGDASLDPATSSFQGRCYLPVLPLHMRLSPAA